jgi:spermidine synthase
MLSALYFLSGATGLCYEVLWARMLSALFGVSIFGAAATVTAFMLGLGAGALLARRRADRIAPSRALRWFALLELAVALYALFLPAIHALAGPWLDALAAQLPWWQWMTVQGAAALVLLTVPAVAMGAGFPMVLRAYPWSPRRLGRLYGINCLGAAAGALAGLALLAGLGWSGALQVVAGTGALIAACAALLGARAPADRAHGTQPREQAHPGTRPAAGGASPTLLLAYAGVGAGALMLEIGWTRLYGMVMLRTEYVLAIILAVFLVGTALGSLLAAHAHRRRWVHGAVPLAACGCTLLGLWLVPEVSVWVQRQHFPSLTSALLVQALLLGALTLPTTAALGAWLPLIAHRIGAHREDAAPAAILYGSNCLGAAAGAVFAVLAGIPLLGTTATIALAAVLLLALGLGIDRLAPAPSGRVDDGVANAPAPSLGRAAWLCLPLAMAAAWALREFPAPDRMLPAEAGTGRTLYRYEDALNLNHVTETADGQRVLLTDLQHMDASSDPAAVQIQADQARLALLLHRSPRSILFLGLGTGVSASGSLAYPGLARTAVELSPGAIEAARRWFAPVNAGVAKDLQIRRDDARHFLCASREPFDVIVGDLFHPDLAGMSNLLSVEQFQRARARLSADGVFVQWIALNQFDRDSLHVVLRSFQRAFPDAQLFLDGMHLALVGSVAPHAYGAIASAAMAGRSAGQVDAATGKEGLWTWLGRYWGPVAAGIGPVQSETRPVIEYRLPRLRYLDQAPLAEILLEMLRRRPDIATAEAQLGIDPAQHASFASAYVANELAVESWLAGLAPEPVRVRELTRLAYESNPRDHWIASALADDLYQAAVQAHALADRATLDRILRIFPEHLETLRALARREQAAGGNSAGALAQLRAVAPLDRDARIGGAVAPATRPPSTGDH